MYILYKSESEELNTFEMIHSGLQRDVLHLYRSLLRTAIKKAAGNKTTRNALLSVGNLSY